MIKILSHILNHQATKRAKSVSKETLFRAAQTFLETFYGECQGHVQQTYRHRLHDVRQAIFETGTYTHTRQELEYGARVAWRNSTRCIGRVAWETLAIRDCRNIENELDIFAACVQHLRYATNGGRIRPTITVFAPETPKTPTIRIWNAQLLRYAGYQQTNGSVLGDPLHVMFTDVLCALGWTPSAMKTPFDLLPLVVQIGTAPPMLFEFDRNDVLEVALQHPQYAWFSELQLQWYAVPVISNMRLEIGGLSYCAAPFNGWYMGTEIGARNLGDVQRYNQLPRIARRMGLPMTASRTLWKDRALVELNIAVLDSFAKQGVTIVDHHTAAHQFIVHERKEQRHARSTFADWGWIVPPLSSSITPVFHRDYVNTIVSPNFFYQPDPWTSQ